MALGTIVAIGPTVRRKLRVRAGTPDAADADRAGARGRAARRRRGGGVKHPFRWIALAVGAGVCVLAVVLALTVSSDPHQDANTSRLVGKQAPAFTRRGRSTASRSRRRASRARRCS